MRKTIAFAALLAVAPFALAEFGVNGFTVFERVFNDFPGSTLTVDKAFPNITIEDMGVSGQTGFANRHDWAVSANGGANPLLLDGNVDFSLDFSLRLSGNGETNKEAGVMLNNSGNGDHIFLVKTGNGGEVAAFGGGLPFFSFTNAFGARYTLGETVELGLDYRVQGNQGFVQYRYNNLASGFLAFSNSEGKLLAGTRVGGYMLVVNDPNEPDNSLRAEFTNVAVVPEPATLAAFAALVALAARRRRR